MHAAKLAVRLLLAGFKKVEEVAGLSSKAIEKISASPKELAILSALVKLMDDRSAQARASA